MIYNANSFVISFDCLIYDVVMKSKTRLSSDEIVNFFNKNVPNSFYKTSTFSEMPKQFFENANII